MITEPNKIEEVFSAALQRKPGPERTAFLDGICGEDSELREQVEALLSANESTGDFLEASPIGLDITMSESPISEGPGTVIDRYRLLEKIGEGGMAVVYMAEQEKPIRRKVALKIIKLGMDTKSVIARFEAERQALAMMDHPNIAKVFDAGTTATGRPYFVMELVRGVSITEYCDKNMLNTSERLNLFIQICSAVQHAHQKGIIHRDIKPTNVMVTLHEGKPLPMVIDFGIAKATSQRLTEKTLFTQYAQIIGTPEYMSPEQAEMSRLDVDTRTDVYSLGVLLYELLTGTLPFEMVKLWEAGYQEIQRIIREQEPDKPSTKLSTMGEALNDIAKHRKANAESLPKLIRGDLDWIVMKCLEKDRTRRFETASELAADIRRHLNNEPIVARPPSMFYKFQKAWGRNKIVYTAACMVVASLIIGISLSVWQAIKATRAEKRANANAILASQNSELAEQRAIEARENEINALRRAYNSDMSLAFHALEENVFGQVKQTVDQHVPEPGEPDFRGWEWRYAWVQSQSDAVYVWDTPEEMDEVFAVKISPDQRYMVSAEFNPGPTSSDLIRRLWNFETRQELKHVHLPDGSNRGFAFSNSGKYLALHCKTEKQTHEIHIYNTITWRLETVIVSERKTHSLAFSPDDTLLATIGPLKAILWDWQQQKIIHQWHFSERQSKGGYHYDIEFFPDNSQLAIGGASELKVVDYATGEILHTQPAPKDGITALAVSPDGLYVAIGAGYETTDIAILNTASWKQEPSLTGHSNWVTSLTFSTNSGHLISTSADNTIRIWDITSRTTIRILKGHQSEVFYISLTSDESRAVTAGKDKRIFEWNLNVPLSPFREYLLDETVKGVIFSPDSQSFYTNNKNGRISIRDAKTLSKQHSSSQEFGADSSIILAPKGGNLIVGTGLGHLYVLNTEDFRTIAHRNVQTGLILPVGFTADGTALVILESGNKISLWDIKTWQLRSRAQTSLNIEFFWGTYCAIPQNSDMLLYPSGADLVWWDLKQSVELTRLRVNSRRSGVIATSPTEPLLASAARGDFIFLWNWKSRQPMGHLRGTRAFHGVAFSPDGRRLVSGGNGKGALMLWDVSTRQEIARFGTHITALLHSVQFSPDGNIICAVDSEGTAYFWRAPSFETINAMEAKRNQTESR